MDRADEFSIIARYFRPLAAGHDGALGLLDDAALVPGDPARTLVVTVDTLIEGVHFRAGDPPETLAGKLIAVNLSDLAAMAATPVAYLLAISLPSAWNEPALLRWLDDFASGLAREQARFGIHLIGGDTVATPGPLVLTLTAFGHVARGCELRRSRARTGDDVYVSGTIGDGHLGLRVLDGRLGGLTEDDRVYLTTRYRQPEPRVGLGTALAGLAHAAADVSDGLVADLSHICRASGVAARIDAALVPLSPAARRVCAAGRVTLSALITGGDDYELLATAPPAAAAALSRASARAGVALTPIGRIIEAADTEAGAPLVTVLDVGGQPLDVAWGGYRHL
jgi:thiamine-monophosphate kinase